MHFTVYTVNTSSTCLNSYAVYLLSLSPSVGVCLSSDFCNLAEDSSNNLVTSSLKVKKKISQLIAFHNKAVHIIKLLYLVHS